MDDRTKRGPGLGRWRHIPTDCQRPVGATLTMMNRCRPVSCGARSRVVVVVFGGPALSADGGTTVPFYLSLSLSSFPKWSPFTLDHSFRVASSIQSPRPAFPFLDELITATWRRACFGWKCHLWHMQASPPKLWFDCWRKGHRFSIRKSSLPILILEIFLIIQLDHQN